MTYHYALDCKNKHCGVPIVLPLPIHSGIPPHQFLWPKDEKPRNFLCLKCKHVYEYMPEDVRSHPGGVPAPHLWDDIGIFRIEAKCGTQNCESRVRILVCGSANAERQTIKLIWFGNPIFAAPIRCLSGETSYGVLAGQVEVQRDNDWF